MSKHRPDQEFLPRSQESEIRASASRIIDILQQLVLARPEMIIPLEGSVREFLATRRIGVGTHLGEGQDELTPRGRTTLPRVPSSELPDLLALLEPPVAERTARKRAGKQRRR